MIRSHFLNQFIAGGAIAKTSFTRARSEQPQSTTSFDISAANRKLGEQIMRVAVCLAGSATLTGS